MARITALAGALAALALGACGGGDQGDYRGDFAPISKDIIALGERVGKAVENAGESSDEQLADDFGSFAEELGGLRQDFDELEPPDDLADDHDDLSAAMQDVQDALEEISAAAEDGDVNAARQATVDLLAGSRDLRDARRKLARAVRGR